MNLNINTFTKGEKKVFFILHKKRFLVQYRNICISILEKLFSSRIVLFSRYFQLFEEHRNVCCCCCYYSKEKKINKDEWKYLQNSLIKQNITYFHIFIVYWIKVCLFRKKSSMCVLQCLKSSDCSVLLTYKILTFSQFIHFICFP